MIEGETPNTVELANLLPLPTERQGMREQWLRRLLKNPLLAATAVMEPFARAALARAARNGQTVLLTMDQTDLGDRMALLVVALRVGDRALPLAWLAEARPANIGFDGQQRLLEQVLAWLPPAAKVLLSAERFYPSAALFAWVQARSWGYRLRLKGNVLADTGQGDGTTTGALAQGVTERYLPGVRLFTQGVMTHLGILQEAGHPEPWIIAMDCTPSRAAVLDYAARWAIEPMFSDFKARGFQLEDSQLEHPERLERLVWSWRWQCTGVSASAKTTRRSTQSRSKKNARAKRSGALELQEAPPQLSFLVHAGPAPLEAMLTKRYLFARLLWIGVK